MSRKNKKEELINATMEIVAEKGMPAFSMRKVTMKIGVSEALIYRHFGTKENLFWICFERVLEHISEEMDKIPVEMPQTPEEIDRIAEIIWRRFLQILVDRPHETMFFLEYREYYFDYLQDKYKDMNSKYFSKYAEILEKLLVRYSLYQKIDQEYFWAYVTDVAGFVAKRIIRRQIEDTLERKIQAWELVWRGIAGQLHL